MLRWFVHSLYDDAFVSGMTCRRPTCVGNLTARVKQVNLAAILFVDVCCAKRPTTSPVIISVLWSLSQALLPPLLGLHLPSSLTIPLLLVCPTGHGTVTIRHRRGINTAVVSEVMVEKEISAKGLTVEVDRMKYADQTADYRRGMTDSALPKAKVMRPKVDTKGKGKAIDAYEQAGPSRITEIVEPAPSGRVNQASGSFSSARSSVDSPPIRTVDDDETICFTLGLMEPPKYILKRRASDSDITPSAILA